MAIPNAETIPEGLRIYCDVSDLLFYLKHHSNVSGIQRVISSVIVCVSNWEKTDVEIAWCVVDPITNVLQTVDRDSLKDLIEGIRDRYISREHLDKLLQNVEISCNYCSPKRGDLFVVLGAFWVFDHAAATLMRLRRSGVRTALIIYDLIPIQHPEFCEKSLTLTFTRQMRSIAALIDCAITISEHVRIQFENYIQKMHIDIPVLSVPLGHDKLEVKSLANKSDVYDISGEYVLTVGTIEIRKNHSYLFNVWKQLIASQHFDELPKLVIVGRRGWRVDDFLAQLEATNYLNGQVIVLESVTDAQLDDLYRGCLFTMFVSFVEGWGLPVGESLSRGKLCVASQSSSIPEIGGNLPIYVDPYNVSQGKSVVERLLADRDYLRERTEMIRNNFEPRSWESYTQMLFSTIEQAAFYNSVDPFSVADLPEATWLSAGESLQSDFHVGVAFIEGWYQTESWGRWMSAPQALIEFKGLPGCQYCFVAEVRMPPWLDRRQDLEISGRGLEKTIISDVPGHPVMVKLVVSAGQEGVIAVRFRCRGPVSTSPSDPRTLYAGLSRFMFYSIEDPLVYMRGLETIVFSSLNIMG